VLPPNQSSAFRKGRSTIPAIEIHRIPYTPAILIVVLALNAQPDAPEAQQPPFQGLIAAAEAIVAVEIVSTDYTLTAADGPMIAVAKILKVLRGPLSPGSEVRFLETAWVGPSYQKGEYRILFLVKVASTEFPRATGWRIASRQDARTDFFIERSALSELSLQSLDAFLKRMGSKDMGKKVVFAKGS
jgi:hypothetical protein